MPGFCVSIVFAFVSGMKLFEYVADQNGGESARAWLGGESRMRDMASKWEGESNPQDAIDSVLESSVFFGVCGKYWNELNNRGKKHGKLIVE